MDWRWSDQWRVIVAAVIVVVVVVVVLVVVVVDAAVRAHAAPAIAVERSWESVMLVRSLSC